MDTQPLWPEEKSKSQAAGESADKKPTLQFGGAAALPPTAPSLTPVESERVYSSPPVPDHALRPSQQLNPIPLTPDPLVGKSVGGYVIEQPLSEGGMGLVYIARHPILNRRFAVKVLRPEAAENAWVAKSFLREAQTLSALKHPHVVDIVDFGQLDDTRQYMVMEYLEGKTLAHELAEKGRLPCARVLELAEQILDALDAAHSVDVIHRDLKPANVILHRVSGGREMAKLVDFGLSKIQPTALQGEVPERASALAGTPEYLAPEQARGLPACKQSDLYSFGVMLFEMLTGQLPFALEAGRVDRTVWLLNMHANMPAPKITPLPNGSPFPQELENLVADLLAKQPQDRPQTAGAARQKVQKILASLTREAMAPLAEPTVQTPAVKRVDTVAIALEVPPRRVWPFVVGGIGAVGLLGLAASLFSGNEPPPKLAPGETVVTTRTAPPPPPTPPADELAPLAPPSKLEPRTSNPIAPAPEVKPVVHAKKPPPPPKEDCDPSPKWRASAQARMQEIQNAAAADSKLWSSFERAEPAITEAISKAETPEQCGDVEQRIRTLARGLKAGGKP
jgi:serine/threonine-protein kinase